MPDTFARRLRAARERLGVTQEDLATASGIGRIYVARYESGSSAPSIYHLQRLAHALSVSMESLLPPMIRVKGMSDE